MSAKGHTVKSSKEKNTCGDPLGFIFSTGFAWEKLVNLALGFVNRQRSE